MKNEKWKIGSYLSPSHCALPLRGKVSFARANLRLIGRALDLYTDGSKLTIACFVRWIVTQTVLRADLCCYTRKGRARVLQTRREEIPATARLRQLIHFAPRKIVEVAADLRFYGRD